jgi:hypothetical protein
VHHVSEKLFAALFGADLIFNNNNHVIIDPAWDNDVGFLPLDVYCLNTLRRRSTDIRRKDRGWTNLMLRRSSLP